MGKPERAIAPAVFNYDGKQNPGRPWFPASRNALREGSPYRERAPNDRDLKVGRVQGERGMGAN